MPKKYLPLYWWVLPPFGKQHLHEEGGVGSLPLYMHVIQILHSMLQENKYVWENYHETLLFMFYYFLNERFIHPFVCLSIYLFVCQSTYPAFYLSVCLFDYLYVCMSVSLSVILSDCFFCQYVSLSMVKLPICLTVSLSVCMFIYLSIHLSV